MFMFVILGLIILIMAGFVFLYNNPSKSNVCIMLIITMCVLMLSLQITMESKQIIENQKIIIKLNEEN